MPQIAPTWKILSAIGVAIFLWSGNNVATKIVITEWPPMWATCLRFFVSSSILLGAIRFFPSLGVRVQIDRGLRRRLWLGPGLSFTVYIMAFIWALKFTTASNVALYFATSPVFAMSWDRYDGQNVPWKRMLLASCLTLIGVIWLFLPTLSGAEFGWIGDGLAFTGSLLWVHFSHLSKKFQGSLPAAQLNGEIFWRTAILLSPFALYDQFNASISWDTNVVIAHVYSTIGPSIIAFMAWSFALKNWPTSKVMLFVNLVPLLTALWAKAILGESVHSNFWVAMVFVATGVCVSLGRLPGFLRRKKD